MKRILFRAAGLAATALVLAACSNNSTTPPAGGGTTTSSSSGTTMSGATVHVADNGTYGKILTDGEGNTLYLFESDQGTKSACTTGCSSTWHALTVSGQPTAGDGATASLVGSAKQSDGSMQVTYNGHLVYTYSGDSTAGDTNGEGIGGVWFVVSSNGDAVQQAMSGGSSSSSGGYSYH
jgi:predicted lipoprotein with Yx(FWY)xxD motif